MSGVDATFNKKANAVTTITVPVSYDLTKPIVIAKSIALKPEVPGEGEEFTAELEIANLSKTTEARNVMVHLEEQTILKFWTSLTGETLPNLPKETQRLLLIR